MRKKNVAISVALYSIKVLSVLLIFDFKSQY